MLARKFLFKPERVGLHMATILVTGASGMLGQHLVVEEDTPLCNVWLTMLQGMGINTDQHGDSTGVVKELQS